MKSRWFGFIVHYLVKELAIGVAGGRRFSPPPYQRCWAETR
ncbi:uncharacterized protein G2W53_041517 [Senna tora]|uniref:Uncharacterized protein n=1 Tax=Senna tora TaxID=362788 RepID=A0A834SFU8_9FABA|nr:uncharacterized protein G2W53_041517 [Senna tora]